MGFSYLVLVLLLAPSLCQEQKPSSQEDDSHHHHHDHYHGQDGQYDHSNDGRGWDIRLSVPGEPERDYPVLNVIPQTGFNCADKESGYYADVGTRCQVFRVCTTTGPSGFYSFLCPNGTLFNEQLHVCDWWMNVKCEGGDAELLSTGRLQIKPGPGMLDEIKSMIMYPMSHPFPPNYSTTKPMTMQVYNPPSAMMSVFLKPPKDIEGQQLLGDVTSPNLPPHPTQFTTAVKHDSFTSGTTSFNKNPIIVDEFLGHVANTPTVQKNLKSKFIQQQAEILNLQNQYNSNTQSIKITKQQYTYPSEFDKQITVTVPKIPTPVNQPFVVNIPVNIPAIDGNENLVSEEMIMDETNNRKLFKNLTNSYEIHQTTAIAQVPFFIILFKPTEHNHNNDHDVDNNVLTNVSDINNLYNDHSNFVQSSENRDNANTNSINYFFPQGTIQSKASITKNPENHYIPTNDDAEEFDYYTKPGDYDRDVTLNEYNETVIDLKDAKDFKMTESEKDLLMEQLNKHIDKQENELTKSELTSNTINTTNSKSKSLVTIFSAHILTNGDETDEQILQLCVPKDVLLYLIKIHNATKQALERHNPNYKFPPHNPSSDNTNIEDNMINMLMNNVMLNKNGNSNQQVANLNDAELLRSQQQFVAFHNQASIFENTNRKVTDSLTGSRLIQTGTYNNVPYGKGNTQYVQSNNAQTSIKYHDDNGQSQGDLVNKILNQQTGVVNTQNRYSAKFNKEQLDKFSNGQISGQVQTNVQNNFGNHNLEPTDEKYDQYRITSSVDGPKTYTDEENRGEFFSLQHFDVRQQRVRPNNNVNHNNGNTKQDLNNIQGERVNTNHETHSNNGQNQISNFKQISQNQVLQSNQNQITTKQQNQITKIQQNDAQIVNGFTSLNRPMPFTRTQNSPPQQNINTNKIFNKNMAGFINNQQTNAGNTQAVLENRQQTIPGANNNIQNNPQTGTFSYSQETSKTFGPIATEYNRVQSTKFVQSSPGNSQQSQYSFKGQQQQQVFQNKNNPTVTRVFTTPTVSTHTYQEERNVVSNNGVVTQNVKQTTQFATPVTNYQQQQVLRTPNGGQTNRVVVTNGQTNTYSQNTKGAGGVVSLTVSQINNGNTKNKYDQVLSIQRQLGGSNYPMPFTKTVTNNKQNGQHVTVENRQSEGGLLQNGHAKTVVVQNNRVQQNEAVLNSQAQRGIIQNKQTQKGSVQNGNTQNGQYQNGQFQIRIIQGGVQGGNIQQSQFQSGIVQFGQIQRGQVQNGGIASNRQFQSGITQNGQTQSSQVIKNVQRGQVQAGVIKSGQQGQVQSGVVQNGQQGRFQSGVVQNGQRGQVKTVVVQNGQSQREQVQNGQIQRGQIVQTRVTQNGQTQRGPIQNGQVTNTLQFATRNNNEQVNQFVQKPVIIQTQNKVVSSVGNENFGTTSQQINKNIANNIRTQFVTTSNRPLTSSNRQVLGIDQVENSEGGTQEFTTGTGGAGQFLGNGINTQFAGGAGVGNTQFVGGAGVGNTQFLGGAGGGVNTNTQFFGNTGGGATQFFGNTGGGATQLSGIGGTQFIGGVGAGGPQFVGGTGVGGMQFVGGTGIGGMQFVGATGVGGTQFAGNGNVDSTQFVENGDNINRIDTQFVNTANRFGGIEGQTGIGIEGQTGIGIEGQTAVGGVQTNLVGGLIPGVGLQGNVGFNGQNGVGLQGSVGFPVNSQSGITESMVDQSSVNTQGTQQGGFQINTRIGGMIPQTQMTTVTSNGMTNVQTDANGVQIVPAYGFRLDNEQERKDFIAALARGFKGVDKAYIPPYDDTTSDFMVSEINRQSQNGQFTPATFDAMFNGINSGQNVGVRTMINGNFGGGVQTAVDTQLGETDTMQNMVTNQAIPMMNTEEQMVAVEELGYPRERPMVAFTF